MTTIDDYAAQTRLPKGLFQDYLEENRGKINNTDVPINKFRDAMTESLEKQLQETNETLSQADCKIVDITFSFNNTTLFDQLEKRANALKKGNFSDLVEI